MEVVDKKNLAATIAPHAEYYRNKTIFFSQAARDATYRVVIRV